MLSQDELFKNKYLLIPKILKCALWEYDIRTRKLTLIRKLDGKWSDRNTQIENYRDTVLSWNSTHPDDIDIFKAYCDSMDNGDESFEYEFRAITDQNKYEWLRYSGASLKDENGVPVTVIGITSNITNEKTAELEAENKKLLDRSTGLLNSRSFRSRIINEFSCCDSNSIHGLIMINISNFGYLSETFGNTFAESVIGKAAHAIADTAESDDITGRYSHDTFVLLRKDIRSKNEMTELAQMLIDCVSNIDVKRGQSAAVNIGTAVYPYDGPNYETLCENTSKALCESRRKGINSYCCFENTFAQYTNSSNTTSCSDIPKAMKSYALDTLTGSDDLSAAIERVLSQTGQYLNLSRIYIVLRSDENQLMNVRHSWVSDGGQTPADNTAVNESWEQIQESFYESKTLKCCDADDPEFNKYRKLLRTSGIHSFIYFGIYSADKCIGYVAFEDCLSCRNWSDSITASLHDISCLLSLALIKVSQSSAGISSCDPEKPGNYICETDKTYSYAIDSRTCQLLYLSPVMQSVFPEAAPGKICYEAFHTGSKPCSVCPVLCSNSKEHNSKDIFVPKYNIWMRPSYRTEAVPGHGDVCCISWQDISEFIISSNEFDPWTNVYTYARFACEADRIITAQKPGHHVIVYTQINNYNDLISEFGFNVIKNVIRLFAGEMSVTLKNNEIMCRVHDSEFAVLFGYNDKTNFFTRICMTLNSIVSAVNDRYSRVNPKISLGFYYLGDNDSSVTSCIDKAHTAMKSLSSFISPSPYQSAEYDQHMKDIEDRNSMFEANMTEALANDEFKVFLQPKLDIRTGKITGAEAHVRWLTDEGGCYYPSEFLETFEHNGYMFEIEMCIYKKLFRKLREWLDSGKNIQRISINVSQCTLLENNFEKCIEKLISLYRIPRNFIEIEIPERLILPNISKLLVITDSLKSKGYRITLDNFGTGPSSMKLIRLLPFDVVKLDRQLFVDYNIDDTLPIIREALEVTRRYNKDLVAVGVQKNEHALVLEDIGCTYVQGYMYYYPMTFDEFEKNILSDKQQ
ncbi:MAG: EAL domain-containing protein [Oscillospiraceae bacterium]|nr:EAL domain-containing protein [Oscillospiraceae bacterium]